mmetsp:Transcript_9096/g.19195  ORF Transcript_9096/g.19195 Transcript_9096/m.19195 type:complete len:98 (-) Transcript_9096:1065-1358(-)
MCSLYISPHRTVNKMNIIWTKYSQSLDISTPSIRPSRIHKFGILSPLTDYHRYILCTSTPQRLASPKYRSSSLLLELVPRESPCPFQVDYFQQAILH